MKLHGEFFYDESEKAVRWENSWIATARNHAEGRAFTVLLNGTLKVKARYPANVLNEAEALSLAAGNLKGDSEQAIRLLRQSIEALVRYLRG